MASDLEGMASNLLAMASMAITCMNHCLNYRPVFDMGGRSTNLALLLHRAFLGYEMRSEGSVVPVLAI